MVVREVGSKDPSQMSFVDHDDVIQTLTTDRTDQAFHVRILPRRARCRDLSLAETPSRTVAAFRRSWLEHSDGVRTCWRRSDPCEGKFGAYALHSPGAPSNSRRSVLRLRGSIGDEGRRLAESRQLGRGGAVRLLALSERCVQGKDVFSPRDNRRGTPGEFV